MRNLFWRLVFWWKKRTGWIDLNQIIQVTGIVIDRNFDVKVDPGLSQT